jgi:hypothetical protein
LENSFVADVACAAGPSSHLQQQLASLLFSLLKLAAGGPWKGASSALVHNCHSRLHPGNFSEAAAAAAVAAAAQEPSAHLCLEHHLSRSVQVLPMVVLIGRCYLQYGSRLQQLLHSKGFQLSPTAPPTASVVNNNRPAREAFSAQEWTQLAEHGLAGRSQSLLLTSSDIILVWMLLSEELSRMGYDAQLMAQLSQLVIVVKMAVQAAPSEI